MPDSSTERSRRSRLHAKGVHTMCSPKRCYASRTGRDEPPHAEPDRSGLPEPPVRLGDDGWRMWHGVVAEFELAAHELELLAQACVVLDFIMVADARLEAEGLMAAGRYRQPVPHPLLKMQVEYRRQYAALLAQLGLSEVRLAALAGRSRPLPAGVTELPRRGDAEVSR